MNSPWAIMATCMNWLLESPTISSSFLSVSFCGYSVPSGMVSDTDLPASVWPPPRLRGRTCRGTRRTVYSFLSSPFPSENISSTKGSVSYPANWL